MLLDTIALTVFLLSIGGVVVMIVKKFPVIASIDSSTATVTAEDRKTKILETRLRRKVQGFWTRVADRSEPVMKSARAVWDQAHQKLVDLEHEYKVRSLPVFMNRRQRQKVDADIHALLEQADVFISEGETAAAEEKCLQAIRLEPRSIPAFELLGDLYMRTGEHVHAKEVYLYLQKLITEPDAIARHDAVGQGESAPIDIEQKRMSYALYLAQVYRGLGEWENAFTSIQTAAEIAPNNPKVLDECIDISIEFGKKGFAEDALEKIQSTNPDNSKIPEWQERIKNMPAYIRHFDDEIPS